MRFANATEDSGAPRRLRGRRRVWAVGVAWGLSFAVPPVSAQEAETPIDYDAAIAQSGIEGSYGYLRALDGSATLIQGDTRERVQLAVNEPILAGDRIFASGESRIEISLADGNLVRIGDRAELLFRALANSADTSDPASILELARGRLQLVVAANPAGSEWPSIITPNATIRPRGAGSFLIVVDDERRSEVVVREGVAEVTTGTELAEVRRGESLLVEGARGDRLRFAAAPGLDRLEAWGQGLGDYAGGEYTAHVEPDLHYAASSLEGHGSWVDVGAGVAWRPRVSTGWAPYRHGRWRHTPSGMFWVSYEPWGWVPYHYGYWDLDPDWGWIWFPGQRFAVAHVYWYWGPSYAGWIPSGYYWRHYRNYYGSDWGFHFGVYGHIGGGFGRYRHWTFLPHGRLGHRRQHFYSVGGSNFGRGRKAVERGVLLTDSRLLGRQAQRRPAQTLASLRRAVSRDGRTAVNADGFIDRGAGLPREVERVVLRGRDGRSARPRDATAGATSGNSRTAGSAPVRVTRRSPEAGTLRLERSGVQGTTRSGVQGTTRSGVQGTTRTGVQRATQRSGVQRATPPAAGTGARPAIRRPTARDAPDAARRPAVRPTTRTGSGGVQRANPRTARESPAVRRTGGTTTRPATRPSAPRSSRPAVRPPGPSRSSGTVSRSSGGSRSGGAVRRSGGSSRSGGTVRRSGGSSRSGGAVRRSGGSSRSGGTVRRSGGSSRSGGTVRRSGGSSRSGGAVRRSGGSSRSGGAVRRSGG
ncbi:MAG: FecR domain-containing protein [Gemmatimonadetes bacterium]|nr:FecR domain-containing protein [Candidatus Palauibacter rhopaloidicola]